MQIINLSYKNKLSLAANHIDKALHKDNPIAQQRLKILLFYKEFGFKATSSAFDVSRPTLLRWQQAFKRHGTRGLIPLSKKPYNLRKSKIGPQIEQFIIKYRSLHPRVCQYSIKPELDDFCRQNNLSTISTASIQRIISKLKQRGILICNKRLRINALTGKVHIKNKPKYKKQRIGRYQPKNIGDIVQIDSVHLFSDGIKRYLITAVDIKSRFAYSEIYSTLNSTNAQDFMQKLQCVAPFKINRVQTDNGQEFEKHFHKYLSDKQVEHYHNYPRSPKSNAYVERFNRTIKEQFVYCNREAMFNTDEFRKKLTEYLIWYNTKRVHKGLNYITPMQYILKQEPAQIQSYLKSHMY